MSQKQVKRARRKMRALLGEFEPIAEQVMHELEDDEELFMKWFACAASAKLISPQTPIEKFLPDRLDATFEEIYASIPDKIKSDINFSPKNKIFKHLTQIEDTP